jgi:hypothetical protein
VSKTWYFASGHVGANSQESITMWNPNHTTDCPVTIQYLLQGGMVIPKSVLVPHASHLTESVNQDLGFFSQRPFALSVSTILKVPVSSSCSGILAQRSILSGGHNTSRSGAPGLGQSFYFISSGSTFSLTALNPTGGKPATISVTYYAYTHQIGTQTLIIQPGTSTTIAPTNLNLPAHTAWIIKSTQPIMVEPSA